MQLKLGDKIRALRNRDGRTQEMLATALGITSQAVSRWESNGSYPDMEIIPSLANYFGITLDELFGYDNDRDAKVKALIARCDKLAELDNSTDVNFAERISLLREGLAEFPANEELVYNLAETLSQAGWRRLGERFYYSDDEDGYSMHDVEYNSKNEYWHESISLFERLTDTTSDSDILMKSIHALALLYRNIGEYDKGVKISQRVPLVQNCREIMLANATDGAEHERYMIEALDSLASNFAMQTVYLLTTKLSNFKTELPIRKLKGAISIFDVICDEGNYGKHSGLISDLYLYLSEHEWRFGYHDDAFNSLDKALYHSRKAEEIYPTDWDRTAQLPKDWPMWMIPNFEDVKEEITKDPRWDEWVRKTQEKF